MNSPCDYPLMIQYFFCLQEAVQATVHREARKLPLDNPSKPHQCTHIIEPDRPEALPSIQNFKISLGESIHCDLQILIRKGQISLTATMPQSNTFTHLGAFFSANRAARTASTSQLAEKDILTTLRKTSVNSLTLSVTVDHGLDSIDLPIRDSAMLGESGHKGGKTSLKGPLNKLFQLRCLDLILGDKRSDNRIFIFQYTPLGKAFDDGVGGGGLPTELGLAKPHQLLAAHRLMLPQDQAEAVLHSSTSRVELTGSFSQRIRQKRYSLSKILGVSINRTSLL